ncbi:MAG: hypothetical protein LBI31_06975 [Zoogloeaceae bacterium]|nr:hypothetical protein [Zoogloeaceae bacterium]
MGVDMSFSRILLLPLFVGILTLLAFPEASSGQNAGKNTIFCCTADTGQKVCGDITPPQCSGKEVKVYNQRGDQVRVIPARMTQEEKAAQAAEEKKAEAARAADLAQRRRDQTLLDTYSSLSEIDRMQKRAEDSANVEINSISGNISASRKKKQELSQEASSYTAQTMPPALAKSIRDEEMNLQTQVDLLVAKRKELEQTKKRFADERRRYTELTSGQDKP